MDGKINGFILSHNDIWKVAHILFVLMCGIYSDAELDSAISKKASKLKKDNDDLVKEDAMWLSLYGERLF